MAIINLEVIEKSSIIELEVVEKYNTNHDPKTGRFCSGSVAGGIVAHTNRHGGMSVDMRTGAYPKDGYMCAVHADRSELIKADDVMDSKKCEKRIEDFRQKNKDVLSEDGVVLGTWLDPDTGNIYLDISKRFEDKAEAIKYASEHNEKAIWDVKNMENIDTGGTGNA